MSSLNYLNDIIPGSVHSGTSKTKLFARLAVLDQLRDIQNEPKHTPDSSSNEDLFPGILRRFGRGTGTESTKEKFGPRNSWLKTDVN